MGVYFFALFNLSNLLYIIALSFNLGGTTIQFRRSKCTHLAVARFLPFQLLVRINYSNACDSISILSIEHTFCNRNEQIEI